jgi:peroxiredoxin
LTRKVQGKDSINMKHLWIGLIAIALILGGVWAGFVNNGTVTGTTTSTDNAAANDLEPLPVAGHPAPDFTLTNLDGEEVSLSDFRGQPVILNFWATWCGPCRVEMPHLQEAFTTHQDDGVVVLGVNLTERDNPDDIPAFLDEFGLTFPIILDEAGEVARTYKVFGQPASVFVSSDGTVHEVFYGPVDKAFIDARIVELVGS